MSIASTLNKEGVPPFDNPNPPKRDGESKRSEPKPWNIYYVGLILRSRAVLGAFQPGHTINGRKGVDEGAPIPDYFPAIIDEATYYRVQTIVSGRNRHKDRGRPGKNIINVFRGLLFDARTGASMQLVYFPRPTVEDPKRILFKLVPSKAHSESSSIKGGFRYDRLESAFLEFCAHELRPEDFLANPEGPSELVELTGRLLQIESKIGQTQSRIIKEEGDINAYLDIVARLQSEKTAVEARLQQVQARQFNSDVETLGGLKSYAELLKQPPKDQELREKIRVHVRQLVRDIWLLVDDVDGYRTARVQITFHSGLTRSFRTEYAMGHRKAKPTGNILYLADLVSGKIPPTDDLRNFRTTGAGGDLGGADEIVYLPGGLRAGDCVHLQSGEAVISPAAKQRPSSEDLGTATIQAGEEDPEEVDYPDFNQASRYSGRAPGISQVMFHNRSCYSTSLMVFYYLATRRAVDGTVSATL